jgi:UDP-N-acetylglucosamine 2-epimerase (non-hydrolysing)
MKIVVVFGTRPEAIKLAPVIAELRRRRGVDVHVVTTAQHREMLDQVLSVFQIVPDCDLAVMRPQQTLAELSSRVLTAMDRLLVSEAPDGVVVQGDTTSALCCGMAAFYRGVPVGHVEAGLRTAFRNNPFPEEMNRRLTSVLASLHFTPTARASAALLAEGIPQDCVFMTGNTVVDALVQVRASETYRATRPPIVAAAGERLLLVTLHRRESWGAALAGMCQALIRIADSRPDVRVVLPMHLNPVVRATVQQLLGGHARINLIEPLDYLEFVAAIEACWLVLTDSGGVQEEAPVLGRPVLVLRDTTERMEAVEAGVALLVGTDQEAIVRTTLALLDDPAARAQMARPVSPFGDGRAAQRIADLLEARLPVQKGPVAWS